jgi:hypothetical protein
LPFAPIGDSLPFVENQGAKLYWDEQGSGEPLLLIMGLSYPSYMWLAAARFLPTVRAGSVQCPLSEAMNRRLVLSNAVVLSEPINSRMVAYSSDTIVSECACLNGYKMP